MILVVSLRDVVVIILTAALTAVMIMVSIGTFDWHSVHPKSHRRMPITATISMITTVVPTVIINNPDENTRVYAIK